MPSITFLNDAWLPHRGLRELAGRLLEAKAWPRMVTVGGRRKYFGEGIERDL